MIITDLKFEAPRVDWIYQFYPEKLNFTMVNREPNTLELKVGATSITYTRPSYKTDAFYHYSLNVPSNMFDPAKMWLSSKVKFLRENNEVIFFYPYWRGARALFYEDPLGNISQVLCRLESDKQENPNFTVNSFAGVSMIGVPVENVKEASDQIASALGLEDQVQALPAFTTIGDHNGAMLIVPKGRVWQPTKREAAIFPMEITIKGPENKSFDLPGHPYKFNMVTGD